MTSEVCMMNRLAVVLAADSATTVSKWTDGRREDRYFKGANKVFQLSNNHPVGLMIFDSADILSVPWELAIKTFRANLADKSFNTVDEYARELFSFLENAHDFFPIGVQESAAIEAVFQIVLEWIDDCTDGKAKEDHASAIATMFHNCKPNLDAKLLPQSISDADANKIISDLETKAASQLETLLKEIKVATPPNIADVTKCALVRVMCMPDTYLSTTGLVFAGFGDHEIYPATVEYVSYGLIGGKSIYTQKSAAAIDHNNPAWLSGFAQTSMTDTFTLGLSFDVYWSLMAAVKDSLTDFGQNVVANSGGDLTKVANFDKLVADTQSEISNRVLDEARREHAFPLRNVLRFLPVDEMAELAETLITLQSLKEKVTKPSETVGGPIDVAVITKHEGLVWIKRKHFFSSELNSRYAIRQANQITRKP